MGSAMPPTFLWIPGTIFIYWALPTETSCQPHNCAFETNTSSIILLPGVIAVVVDMHDSQFSKITKTLPDKIYVIIGIVY